MLEGLLAIPVAQVPELIRGLGLTGNLAAAVWLVLGGWILRDRVQRWRHGDPVLLELQALGTKLDALPERLADDVSSAIVTIHLQSQLERGKEEIADLRDRLRAATSGGRP